MLNAQGDRISNGVLKDDLPMPLGPNTTEWHLQWSIESLCGLVLAVSLPHKLSISNGVLKVSSSLSAVLPAPCRGISNGVLKAPDKQLKQHINQLGGISNGVLKVSRSPLPGGPIRKGHLQWSIESQF